MTESCPTPPTALPTLAVAALIAAAACQSDANLSRDPFAAEPWTVSEREARIGSVDDPDYIFNPVLRMALGPDALLYTAHAGEATIRRWTMDGALAGSVGRKGEGPGEFQVPYQVGFFGDSLWVWDVATGRVSYFDQLGEFLGSVAARADVSWEVGPVHPIAPLRDGTFMWMRRPPFSSSGPATPEAIPFAKIDADGRRLALIWEQPWEPHDDAGQPFGDAHLSGLGRRGLLVVDRRVWTGTGDPAIRVSEIGFDGDTIFTAAVPYDPVPLTAERFDSVVRAWAGDGAEAGIREAMFRPSYLPAVSHLIGGRDGTIWLRRFDPVEVAAGESMREWWVLDSEGSPLARALTPVDLVVKLITDEMIWGVERDELDVEYIVRYRLMREG